MEKLNERINHAQEFADAEANARSIVWPNTWLFWQELYPYARPLKLHYMLERSCSGTSNQ